ncbi:MAG TPA: acetate--CoA ligase family protein [Clostridia bacterium]|nr:acetate--CoA ligase family protein [Clostridia bacterium]
MKLFEYQAKEVFAGAGIPVPKSVLITAASEIPAAVEALGLPCVLKCQVLSGGRGKAGLVKLVHSQAEAEALATRYFAEVPSLHAVLVEEAVAIERELYLALTMDAVSGRAMLMGCAEGGVEIEYVAAHTPEKIVRETIDLDRGLQAFQISDFTYRLGLREDALKQVGKICGALYKAFRSMDAELIEINPLFLTKDGTAVAGDGKLSIDDNSMHRHVAYEKGRSYYGSDMEFEAAKEGIPYLEFDGDISLMCAGAGLANTVYDLVNYEGGTIANYLEFGGPNYMKAGTAMRLCLANKPKVILIVTFGTIARADVMAEGITKAVLELKPSCPIVACLRGTGEERVDEIFAPIGLKRLSDTEEAVKKAVAIANGRENA